MIILLSEEKIQHDRKQAHRKTIVPNNTDYAHSR